jgi:hypothetical protein
LGTYIRPVVRLEFRCRGDVWPSERRSSSPTLRTYHRTSWPNLSQRSTFSALSSTCGLTRQAGDTDTRAKKILRLRETLNITLAKATGQPMERMERDVHRGHNPGARPDPRILTDRSDHRDSRVGAGNEQ